MIPYPSVGKEAYMNRILQIHKKDPIDLIIPNLDAELFTFMTSENVLKQNNIHTFLPTVKQFEERQKGNLQEYGEKYNIKVPKSISITSYTVITSYSIHYTKLYEEHWYSILAGEKWSTISSPVPYGGLRSTTSMRCGSTP